MFLNNFLSLQIIETMNDAMRKILILIFPFLLLAPISKSQTTSFGNNNFKQIQQAFYNNYAGFGEDTAEAGNFRQFKRWELFWGPRLMPHNNFDTAFSHYRSFIKNFDRNSYVDKIVTSDWQELGPARNGMGGVGRIDAIAFHPTDTNTIYIGCPSGGVWASYNRGHNWQNLNTDQQLPSIGISSIAVDPGNPGNIFIGTGDVDSEWVYSIGIYRTTDGGQNWEVAGLNDLETHFTIGKVLLHPVDSDVAFAATSLGIYKTTNRNSPAPTWQKVYPAGTGNHEYIRNIAFHPANPQILYATGIDIISSYQGGDFSTWYRIATAQSGLDFENTPWPSALNGEEYVVCLNMATAPQGDFLYVNCVSRDTPPPYNWQSPKHYHIFKYDIANEQWTPLSNSMLHGAITPGRTEMVVSPSDSRVLYAGGVRIKVFNPDLSINPWERVDIDCHVDIHELIFSPWEENVLYAGTDGGLYKRNLTITPHFIDNGDGPGKGFYWMKDYTGIINGYPTIELNNGLGISTIYNFGSSPIDPYQILTGSQDCGINYLKDNIWRPEENPNDGFQCLMDRSDIDIMYATIYHPSNGSIYRSTNDSKDPRWQSLLTGEAPINETSWFGASLVADPFNNKTLLQARINLWKIDDASTATMDDWYKITDVDLLTSVLWGNNNCVIYALEIAPSNPDYIYFTGVKVDNWATDFNANRVFKTSTDGGININDWTDITPPTPGNSLGTYFITDIAVSSSDPDKIWISYSGYLEDYKVKFFNGSGWVDYNEGLPNIPTNCLIYVEGSNDGLFIGTDVGVYYRDAGMVQWEPFMTNLPNVKVSWLELNYTNEKLRAGTFGRGLWETKIPAISKVPFITTHNYSDDLIKIIVYSNPGQSEQKIFRFEYAQNQTSGDNNIVTNCGADLTLQIFNLLGKKLHSEQISLHQSTSSITTTNWNPGIYLAIIYCNGTAVGKCKFVVQ